MGVSLGKLGDTEKGLISKGVGFIELL